MSDTMEVCDVSVNTRAWVELGVMAVLLAVTLFVLVASDVDDVGFGLLGLIIVEGFTLLLVAVTAETIRANHNHPAMWSAYAVIVCAAIAGAVIITVKNKWKVAGSVTTVFIAATAISGLVGWTSVVS